MWYDVKFFINGSLDLIKIVVMVLGIDYVIKDFAFRIFYLIILSEYFYFRIIYFNEILLIFVIYES